MTDADALRALPAIDQLLQENADLKQVGATVGRWIARREVEAARARIMAGGEAGDVEAAIASAVRSLTSRRVRRVINATGVVLHTNLGRAPLSEEAGEAVLDALGAASLEYDPEAGERSARAPVAALLAAALCDADDAFVVNNNAGALLLGLGALARGKEVIVSRGELVEIGGAFRLPDIMEASGAIMREVGTTNRTHLSDFEEAITDRTALILKVHPSNFAVSGFTSMPSTTELAELAHRAGVTLLYDIGSGLLLPTEGAPAGEPDARTALAEGADFVCFSGDKLLGGPQAGLLVGNADVIKRCRRDPLARALRADKLTLAALEATLDVHARGAASGLPVWQMLSLSADDVALRARAIAKDIDGASVVDGESVPGGGSAPGATIPTSLISLAGRDPEHVVATLRANDPPVIARVEHGAVVLDLRTVDPTDDHAVGAAVRAALTDAPARAEEPPAQAKPEPIDPPTLVAVPDEPEDVAEEPVEPVVPEVEQATLTLHVNPPVAVRPAGAGDARAVAAIHVRGWQRAYDGIMPADLLDSLSVDHRARFWDNELTTPPEGHMTWLAERDDRVVGFANAGASRDADARGVVGEIYAIYVDPDEWGTGIGRALEPAVRAFLAEQGYQRATLWVLKKNQNARSFYEALGWMPDGATRTEMWRAAPLDEVRYKLDL